MKKVIFDCSTGQETVVDMTPEEIKQLEDEFLAREAQITYAMRRQVEYPPYTDYLDGLVKGDQAQMQAYIDACLAVKAKYPKPQ